MKKLIIIIIGAFTLLFGVNVKGSTFYTLDSSIEELNNHSLREVFENRNIAMPDLSGKEYLGNGEYRIYDDRGLTIDYNVNNGNYIYNGTLDLAINVVLGYFNVPKQSNYIMKLYYVSGNVDDSARPRVSYTDRINHASIQGTYIDTIVSFLNVSQQSFDTQPGAVTYNNYTFKLQIEQGSTLTPYQVPTNGPYSEIDISSLDLTTQEIDYWFNVYQDLLKDIERVNQLPNLFIDLFSEITDNFVLGIKGFTQLIYLDGYGLTDLGIISLIVISISVIGVGFYIIRKVIK